MTPRVEGIDDLVEIGRGGASVVYAGTQQPFGRPVAVKVFGVALGDDGRRRFEREAAVIGALGDCRGIVAVHASAVTDDGRPCTVMPLMAASLASPGDGSMPSTWCRSVWRSPRRCPGPTTAGSRTVT